MSEHPKKPTEAVYLLRRKQVEMLTGLSRSTIYDRMNRGTFPKSLKIGGRLVAWNSNDINQWIREQIDAATNSNGGD